ncbi:MAG: dTMP kinase [Rhodospirillales bacterium]|nr:dTMP kinase [Alphaproteobacteria bacterium]MCB1838658.1 dTMP kinase [Alphaproteobacteria bacterium]MCB9977924.1 dTMP kinase [Rhodospirillales bacterium]
MNLHHKKRPLFITLEGGEGSGKTTQINKLAERLTRENYKVITTREPGGTPEGEKIRSLFVKGGTEKWSPLAEVLLVLAARAMHVERVVNPALDAGKVVVCDRFSDSTVAYQGYGRGVPLEKIERITQDVLGDLTPDVTFILDIEPEVGLKRSTKRMARERNPDSQAEDRFEKMEFSFHQKVRNGFLEIAKREPDRCIIIDAAGGTEKMADDIWSALSKRL